MFQRGAKKKYGSHNMCGGRGLEKTLTKGRAEIDGKSEVEGSPADQGKRERSKGENERAKKSTDN